MNDKIVIDVRDDDEYAIEHIKDSIHIPLNQFKKIAPSVLKSHKGKPVLLMCASGKRASIALEEAKQCGCDLSQVEVFEGGIHEWAQKGMPIERGPAMTGHGLPIMRQVQLAAGLLVLTGVGLALTINPNWIFLSAFVGAGLTVAGATGFCGMAIILSKMPWNNLGNNRSNEG